MAPVWIGGVAATLWLAWVSMLARRWWPLAWILAILSAAGTGLLLAAFGSSFVGAWWDLWFAYIPTLPIVRMVLDRRRRRSMDDAA